MTICYFYRKPERKEYLPRCNFEQSGIWDNYEKYYDDPTKRPGYPESRLPRMSIHRILGIDLDDLSIDEKVPAKKDRYPKSPTLSIRREPWRESTGWGSRTTIENIKKERQRRYNQTFLMDKSCREVVQNSWKS